MRISKVLFTLLLTTVFVACSESSGEVTDQDTVVEQDAEGIVTKYDTSSDEQVEEEVKPEDVPLADWKTYHNERFDFCVSYPANFLTPQGEAENHDGNSFANVNGSSEMRASGIFNALDETAAEAYERATENDRYYDEERVITYKRQKDNWFVASGKYNESIFYVRTTLVSDTFYTLYFEYHSSEENKFSEIIKRNTRVFPDC